MQHLTHLYFSATEERDNRALAECIFSLTELRSLTLWKHAAAPDISPETTDRLTLLTHLTQLSLGYVSEAHSLCFPTGIVDLTLDSKERLPLDLAQSIGNLRNLRALKLGSHCTMDVRKVTRGFSLYCSVEDPRFLDRLMTDTVLMNDNFLHVLGSLTGLTTLVLRSRKRVDPYIVCPRLSPLSNLRKLEIYSRCDYSMSGKGMPQFSLPKLRALTLPIMSTSIHQHQKIWEPFPCLYRVWLFSKLYTR